jgi:hypothetical protein
MIPVFWANRIAFSMNLESSSMLFQALPSKNWTVLENEAYAAKEEEEECG